MDDTQLNTLANKAKSGDTGAMWEIKGYFHLYVVKLSDSSRNQLASQERFENDCFKVIEETVLRFEPSLGNFRQLAVQSIKRRLGRWKRRYRDSLELYSVKFEPIGSNLREQDDGFIEYVVADRLATVDDQLLINEKIASLAGSDPRKLAILNTWSESNNPDSHTADLLAQIFGGKSESHRKFITRLRSQCQTALASAV